MDSSYKNVIRIGVKGRKYSHNQILCVKKASMDTKKARKKVVVKSSNKKRRTSKKKRTLKQVLRESKALDAKYGLESYMSIEVPNSKLPARKYCDITGYEAKYCDPKSKLRYCSVEAMKLIQSLPRNILQKYLSIRNGDSGL